VCVGGRLREKGKVYENIMVNTQKNKKKRIKKKGEKWLCFAFSSYIFIFMGILS
jgi:hypothetical protein